MISLADAEKRKLDENALYIALQQKDKTFTL